MPSYKGHLVGGASVYAVMLYVLSAYWYYAITLAVALEWLLFALAGALFPDIDVKSKGQKYFYWILLLLLTLLLFYGRLRMALAVGIVSLVPMLVRHRGLFHKAWFLIMLASACAFLLVLHFPDCQRIILFDAFFFTLGMLSHLWLDLGFMRMWRW